MQIISHDVAQYRREVMHKYLDIRLCAYAMNQEKKNNNKKRSTR